MALIAVGSRAPDSSGGPRPIARALAGVELAAVAASSPEIGGRGGSRRSAPIAHTTRAEELVARLRRSTSSTSARRTTCTFRSPRRRSRPASTSSARSRSRLDVDGAQRLAGRSRPKRGRHAGVPFVYRYYPTVREARERRRQRADRSAAPAARHATSRTGCSARRTTTGASTPSSAAPRARSPTSARTGATSPSSSPAIASRASRRALLTAVPERVGAPRAPARSRPRDERRRARAVDDRGRRARPVRDRRRRDSARSWSARSRRAARTGSGSSSTAHEARSPSTRSSPEELWCGRREPLTHRAPRPARRCPPAAARFAVLPGGHPQGYARLLRRVRRRLLRGRPQRRRCPTACRRSPTACAPRDHRRRARVVARAGRWVDVAGSRAPSEAVAT